MPSGPKKRRATKKKKKKAKGASKKSVSSPAPPPRHGESDGVGGQLNSPASKGQHNYPYPAVNTEMSKINSSGNKSSTIEKTQEVVEEMQDKTAIGRGSGSNSQKLHETSLNPSSSSNSKSSNKKKAAVIEPAHVPDLVQPIKCLSEKGTYKVEDFAVETPPIVDAIKPIDHDLEKPKLERKNDLDVAETVVNKDASKNNSLMSTSVAVGLVSKENGIETSVSSPQKTSVKSKDYLLASTFKCPFCGRNSADYVNKAETPECSEKQPLLASAPRAAEKASWKSCCGIFELFSVSSR